MVAEDSEEQQQIIHRRAFCNGVRLGCGPEFHWMVSCYSKCALVAWRSQSEILTEIVKDVNPVLVSRRQEVDAVDRTGRIKPKWDTKSKSSHAKDSACKAQLFYGRATIFLYETQLHNGEQHHVRFRFRYATTAMQMPALGSELSDYGSRDKGADLYFQMDTNMPKINLTTRDRLTNNPIDFEMWCADEHLTNINAFWIAIREAIVQVDRERFIRWLRTCLVHGVSTSSPEGISILLIMLDVDAVLWQRRLYLTAAHLASSIGKIHSELQTKTNRGEVLRYEHNLVCDKGGLGELLTWCGRDVEDWKYWELCRGELVSDATKYEDTSDKIPTPAEWAIVKQKGSESLHGLFSRPKTPGGNKWFSNTAAAMGLLIFLAVEYENGYKTWAHRERVWIGEFVDLSPGMADVHTFSLSLVSGAWSSEPFEKFQKRLLISKHRVDAATSAVAQIKLQGGGVTSLSTISTKFTRHRLAKVVTPFLDHENESWTKTIKKVSQAVRWSIICTQTTIVGRSMSTKGEHEEFLREYRAAEVGEPRSAVVDTMLEKYTLAPTQWHSADFGPLVLHMVARTVATFPRAKRYEVVHTIAQAAESEEEHSQRVESEHQTYLNEKDSGGRMGDMRSGDRCASVLVCKTLQSGKKEAQRRLEKMEVLEKIIVSDAYVLAEEAALRAYNSPRLYPYQLFQQEQSELFNYKKMDGADVADHILTRWKNPTVTNQQDWIDASLRAREKAKLDAEEAVWAAWSRRTDATSKGGGSGAKGEDFYVPPHWQKKCCEFYEKALQSVEKYWNYPVTPSKSPTP